MRKVKVITDSCSDLTPELMERYNIDYAQMNTVLDGVTSPADLSWTAADVHSFYNIMRDGKRITTTQVPVEEFNRVFRKYLDLGCDIVYVGCSTKQSGSVNTAHVLAKKLMEEYDGAKISCIDSLRACLGEGMLAIEAAKCAETGADVDEVTEYVKSIRNKVNEYVAVHTLDYLKRAGRVKASAAFFGNLLGVKPILIADANGEQTALKKVKGRQNSLSEIVALMKEHFKGEINGTVFLAHSDCNAEEVELVKEKIKNEIGCEDVYVGYIGPIIGASIGPDAVAIFAMGDEVTFKVGEK